MVKRIFNFLLESIQALVLALSVFVLLYLFVTQPNQVHGRSMERNFHDGEFLLTEKISYHFREPRRGEVVIFKAPPSEACAEDECEYIKRIIGLPGDKVRVLNGRVWVNGQILQEDYLTPEYRNTNPGSYLKEGRLVIVPQGEYIVMGDNRPHSRDSREFGPIPRENIIGRAFFRYWPLNRMGLVEQATYPSGQISK